MKGCKVPSQQGSFTAALIVGVCSAPGTCAEPQHRVLPLVGLHYGEGWAVCDAAGRPVDVVRYWPPGKAPLVVVHHLAAALFRTQQAGLGHLRCLMGFCLMTALAVPVPFAWYLLAQDSGDNRERSSRGPEPVYNAPQMGTDVGLQLGMQLIEQHWHIEN